MGLVSGRENSKALVVEGGSARVCQHAAQPAGAASHCPQVHGRPASHRCQPQGRFLLSSPLQLFLTTRWALPWQEEDQLHPSSGAGFHGDHCSAPVQHPVLLLGPEHTMLTATPGPFHRPAVPSVQRALPQISLRLAPPLCQALDWLLSYQ